MMSYWHNKRHKIGFHIGSANKYLTLSDKLKKKILSSENTKLILNLLNNPQYSRLHTALWQHQKN